MVALHSPVYCDAFYLISSKIDSISLICCFGLHYCAYRYYSLWFGITFVLHLLVLVLVLLLFPSCH